MGSWNFKSNRRKFLFGADSAVVGLPFLPSVMHSALAASSDTVNYISCVVGNGGGCRYYDFHPTGDVPFRDLGPYLRSINVDAVSWADRPLQEVISRVGAGAVTVVTGLASHGGHNSSDITAGFLANESSSSPPRPSVDDLFDQAVLSSSFTNPASVISSLLFEIVPRAMYSISW